MILRDADVLRTVARRMSLQALGRDARQGRDHQGWGAFLSCTRMCTAVLLRPLFCHPPACRTSIVPVVDALRCVALRCATAAARRH